MTATTKECAVCATTKSVTEFHKRRLTCRTCINTKRREEFARRPKPEKVPKEPLTHRICRVCSTDKPIEAFRKRGGPTCKLCSNELRRQRYHSDPDYRAKVIRANVLWRQKNGYDEYTKWHSPYYHYEEADRQREWRESRS